MGLITKKLKMSKLFLNKFKNNNNKNDKLFKYIFLLTLLLSCNN